MRRTFKMLTGFHVLLWIPKKNATSWQRRCANRSFVCEYVGWRREVVENVDTDVSGGRSAGRSSDTIIIYTANRRTAGWHTSSTVTVSELIECNNLKSEYHTSSCLSVGGEEITRRHTIIRLKIKPNTRRPWPKSRRRRLHETPEIE